MGRKASAQLWPSPSSLSVNKSAHAGPPSKPVRSCPAPTGPGRVAAALRALRPQAVPQSSSYSRTGAGCAPGARGGGGVWRGPGAGPRGENAPSTRKLRKRTHLGPEPGGEGGGRGCGFRPSIPLSVRINDWDIGPVWLWRNQRPRCKSHPGRHRSWGSFSSEG